MVKWCLLITSCFLLSAHARDFGTHGTIFPITELDPVVLIQAKLTSLKESWELDNHFQAIRKKVKDSVLHPPPVKGITKATKPRVFYVDPTFIVEHDLKDHEGKLFGKKGTLINPLKTVSLSHTLLFFDGDDLEQKAWVEQHIKTNPSKPIKLILITGAPLALSKELGVPVYFDQGGKITKKLGIRHVPALVNQDEYFLRIEEISIPSPNVPSTMTLKHPSAYKDCVSHDKETNR